MKDKFNKSKIQNLQDAWEYFGEDEEQNFDYEQYSKKQKKFKEDKDVDKGRKLNKRSYK
jgi:hypothetical protein